MSLRLLSWLWPTLFVILFCRPESSSAQRVKPSTQLASVVAAEYEKLASGLADKPGVAASGEKAWAWLMAYALRPEASYLMEAAHEFEKTAPAEAWILYVRYLRMRPNTWNRDNVERRLRELMDKLDSDMRDEAHSGLIIQNQMEEARRAQERGNLRAAERSFALAHAMDGSHVTALAELARIQATRQRWNEEWILWDQVQDAPTVETNLRIEAEARLAELRRAPRSMNDLYISVSGGFLLGGRKLRYQRGPASGAMHDQTGCRALSDARLGVYTDMPCPSLSQPLTPGFFVQLALFPLAAQGPRLLRGLGLRSELQVQPAQSICLLDSTAQECDDGHQLRVENGLVWAYRRHPLGETLRVQLFAGHGYHRQYLPPVPTGFWSSIPEPTYHTLTLGAGVLVPMPISTPVPWSIGFNLYYHAMLNYGELSAGSGDAYGLISSGHGLRIELTPLRLRTYQGLIVFVSGQLELFRIRFTELDEKEAFIDAMNPPQRASAGGILDLLYGMRVGLQYEF